MGALATAVRTRHDHHLRLIQARATSDELFQILRDEAFYERPIAERHRVIFYLGHVEAFDWNLLGQRAFGLRRFHSSFDQLFAFGIDPVGGGLPTDQPGDWPSRAEISEYKLHLRTQLDSAIDRALEHPSEGHPQLLTMLDTAIEHRLMHAETLAYMFHRLPVDKKKPVQTQDHWSTSRIQHRLVEIPEGPATLGLPADDSRFGWDNERCALTVRVPAFSIENHNVSNRQFMHFVQNGGYRERSLWTSEGWAWREQNAIEHPVFCIAAEIFGIIGHVCGTAFADGAAGLCKPCGSIRVCKVARSKAAERRAIHRAAYGVPDSDEQRGYPWGEQPPAPQFGNFDFAHFALRRAELTLTV